MFEIAGILPDMSATGGLGYFRKQNNPYIKIKKRVNPILGDREPRSG